MYHKQTTGQPRATASTLRATFIRPRPHWGVHRNTGP